MKAERKKTIKSNIAEKNASESFYTDLSCKDMIFAVLVRSPISQGTIRAISCPNLPEDCTLITARDIPGKNAINVLSLNIPLLAFEKVSYQGEPIAIVTAPDEETARQVALRLDIRFTRSIEQKKDIGITEDKILAHRIIKYGESDTAFENSELKAEQTISLKLRTSASYTEPDGALAIPEKDTIEVYCPTNWMDNARKAVSTATGAPEDAVTIIRTYTEDCGTNRIWLTSFLAAAAAVASKITKKAVKLVLSRQEQISFIDNPQSSSIRYRSSIDSNGTITSMGISITVDGGAFDPFISETIDRLTISAIGLYTPQNLFIEATALCSQKPPMNTDYRRMDVHAFAALENHLQTLSNISGLTPDELRIKNMKRDFTLRPFKIYSDKSDSVINIAVKNSDFNRKYSTYAIHSREQFPHRSPMHMTEPLRGIGLASAFNGNCYLGSILDNSKQTIELLMDIDGSLTIFTDQLSDSIKKIWTKIAIQMLNIQENLIKFSDTEDSNSQKISNTLFGNAGIMTQLLRKGCTAIQKQRFRQPLPIRIKRTSSSQKRNNWDPENFSGTPFYDASFGTAVIELELDISTLKEEIRGIWIAIDAGEILDTKKAEQTVRSSVERVLSTLSENKLFIEKINIEFIQSSGNPKQIHDLADNIIPGAYLSALSQAIRKNISSIPVTQNSKYNTCFENTPSEGAQDK